MALDKIYTLPKGTDPTDSVVNNLLTGLERKENVRHYDKLYDYYMSEPVVSRHAPHDLRAITNHARYISKTNVGYLLGNPVNYVVDEAINIDKILERYDGQNIGNLDVELADDASIFGHAFERIYVDEEANLCSTRIDPRNVILVRDDTVKHEKMFAVIYTQAYNRAGEPIQNQYDATIITPRLIMERTLKNGVLVSSPDDEDMVNTLGEVTIVEYLNEKNRVGDFEPVITLLDAYNILQSDRVIDRERLVDAILAIYGAQFTKEQREELKSSRVLANLSSDTKIEYIVKNINEADADVLRKTIANDIHKISMTPDMSDENFAGNSSGVALLYKLLAFENHVKEKERYFETALKERFHLYDIFANLKDGVELVKPEQIDVIFKRALPQNDLETSQMINNLVGMVDKETLVSRLSFIQDAENTIKKAEEEERAETKPDDNWGTTTPNESNEELPNEENEPEVPENNG